VEWSAVESASRYVLTIIASDATTVLSRPTTATSLRLDAAALAGRLAGEQLFGQIEAFNALGVALGKSPRFDIPVRREEVQR
jgi:hypothetical protein